NAPWPTKHKKAPTLSVHWSASSPKVRDRTAVPRSDATGVRDAYIAVGGLPRVVPQVYHCARAARDSVRQSASSVSPHRFWCHPVVAPHESSKRQTSRRRGLSDRACRLPAVGGRRPANDLGVGACALRRRSRRAALAPRRVARVHVRRRGAVLG